ncbi:Dolichyl-phosphate beta-D-mannosyltransferase [Cyanobacterium stanieri PCC 7202]|uniref:Dolichyl-phosphate beta-D-mannosyltransferase n=1 Tax=Cyanobacterium stanieri (strain ATCC 29140 / PCC 7202) TaxID=292563 RepID=K9YPE2_CYASC|nr:Dolichyl-phosphate beta-D-mannosyltransferase [Cyanobacterium stanieri PCC 7202]
MNNSPAYQQHLLMENNLLSVPSGLLKVDSLELSHQEDISLLQKLYRAVSSCQSDIWFSLVLPTYQEADNIEMIVMKICQVLDTAIPCRYEIIIVDDDSPDRTWEKALKLSIDYPQIRVMRRQKERSLSTAVIRGWQKARGEILGVIDADLQHPPQILLELLGCICDEADLAVASRNAKDGGVSDWSFIRRCLSRGAQILGLLILPNTIGKVSDPMSGYFVLKRKAIANCVLSPVGYKILIEVIARGHFRNISEVGYVFQERIEGESKVTWKQYRDYIHHLLRLRLALWPFNRFIRFGIVGFSGVFVDMTILYLLSDSATLQWNLTLSKIIAAEVAIINNFIWNDRWTFKDFSQLQKGRFYILKRFLKFNLICLAGLFINVVILNLIVNFLIPNPYIANLMAIAITTLWNFWLNYKLNWGNGSKTKPHP